MRCSISSRIGPTAATPCPAGSARRPVNQAARVTTGLKCAPDTGRSSVISMPRPKTAAGELAGSCTPTSHDSSPAWITLRPPQRVPGGLRCDAAPVLQPTQVPVEDRAQPVPVGRILGSALGQYEEDPGPPGREDEEFAGLDVPGEACQSMLLVRVPPVVVNPSSSTTVRQVPYSSMSACCSRARRMRVLWPTTTPAITPQPTTRAVIAGAKPLSSEKNSTSSRIRADGTSRPPSRARSRTCNGAPRPGSRPVSARRRTRWPCRARPTVCDPRRSAGQRIPTLAEPGRGGQRQAVAA